MSAPYNSIYKDISNTASITPDDLEGIVRFGETSYYQHASIIYVEKLFTNNSNRAKFLDFITATLGSNSISGDSSTKEAKSFVLACYFLYTLLYLVHHQNYDGMKRDNLALNIAFSQCWYNTMDDISNFQNIIPGKRKGKANSSWYNVTTIVCTLMQSALFQDYTAALVSRMSDEFFYSNMNLTELMRRNAADNESETTVPVGMDYVPYDLFLGGELRIEELISMLNLEEEYACYPVYVQSTEPATLNSSVKGLAPLSNPNDEVLYGRTVILQMENPRTIGSNSIKFDGIDCVRRQVMEYSPLSNRGQEVRVMHAIGFRVIENMNPNEASSYANVVTMQVDNLAPQPAIVMKIEQSRRDVSDYTIICGDINDLLNMCSYALVDRVRSFSFQNRSPLEPVPKLAHGLGNKFPLNVRALMQELSRILRTIRPSVEYSSAAGGGLAGKMDDTTATLWFMLVTMTDHLVVFHPALDDYNRGKVLNDYAKASRSETLLTVRARIRELASNSGILNEFVQANQAKSVKNWICVTIPLILEKHGVMNDTRLGNIDNVD
uniref:Uncharacterized protein n=1 Tax=viral metagenome TaxID=1070528 RepID=A0A2V0RGY1_9ZZZZ